MCVTNFISSPFVISVEISSTSLSFFAGTSTVFIPAFLAARSFSFKPPIGSTRPRSVISPVMARSARTFLPVTADMIAVAIVMPADRPRRARRHKPTGAFPSSPADASAACFRPLGAACVSERQRRDFACFLVAADAEGLSPFPVHAVFLPSRRGQPSADGGRVTAQIFLVRTVRMFGCSDSVPITST